MSTYRVTWPCCGDTTETDSWEPTVCPFCEFREKNPISYELAEALESLEMAFVQTCENWIPKPIDIANIEQVAKARAALARYRGE